jgi:predicted alpha/beta-hydrolase family hydrolase
MLFVQGSRDELGSAAELRAVVRRLPHAALHLVSGGDHSLALPKREGPEKQEKALATAADAIATFVCARRPVL